MYSYQEPPAHEDAVGCGLLGCLGGVVAGIAGGALLLLLAAFFMAVAAPDPAPAAPGSAPDLRVTLTEDFLNRYIIQPADSSVTVNVLPNNQFELTANTTVDAFGIQVPVQLVGLLQLTTNGQTPQVALLNTRVVGLDFELPGLFSEDLQTINQNLQLMVDDITAAVGFPVAVTGVTTSDSEVQVEVRAAP
ncbi:MAG: hypothetical protein Kow0031_34790 [Anaerolineae bacterium]